MPLMEQALAFLWTLLIGMFAGFCYQIYRVIREKLKLKKFGTFAGDIMFGISLTLISFALLLKANYGQLRFYFFIGLLVGILVYVKFLNNGSYILINKFFYLLAKIFNLIALIIFYISKAIFFPFKMILLVLQFPVVLVGRLLAPVKNYAGRLTGKHLNSIRFRIHSLADKIAKRFSPPR